MTAFLKIDACNTCHRSLPWEWVPTVLLSGKALSGTGVWRSQLVDGQCPACLAAVEAQRQDEQRRLTFRSKLIQLLGGERPYREFTFERYELMPGSQLAYDQAKHFNPATDNLYLWGACGLGKTHLAWAIARKCLEETLSLAIVHAGQLSRKVRMKDPDQEQAVLDEFVRADVLVVDDLGVGPDTAFVRQILQEILDRRAFADRSGLVVTSKYSLTSLAYRMNDDAIASRLAGMCAVIQLQGTDHRLSKGLRPEPLP